MWWQTSNCSPLLIYRPQEDERLNWPGWLTYSGRLTCISGHPSATGRVQDGERTLARDWRSTAEPSLIWWPIVWSLLSGVQLTGRRARTWQSESLRKFRSTKDVELNAQLWRLCRTTRSSTSFHRHKVQYPTFYTFTKLDLIKFCCLFDENISELNGKEQPKAKWTKTVDEDLTSLSCSISVKMCLWCVLQLLIWLDTVCYVMPV